MEVTNVTCLSFLILSQQIITLILRQLNKNLDITHDIISWQYKNQNLPHLQSVTCTDNDLVKIQNLMQKNKFLKINFFLINSDRNNYIDTTWKMTFTRFT